MPMDGCRNCASSKTTSKAIYHGGHGEKLFIVNCAYGAVNKVKLCALRGEMLLKL